MTPVLVQLEGVSKQYGGLRPFRIQQLSVAAGERVALVGFDQPMAEVFVNLVTGASLPEAGSVDVFGRPSSRLGCPSRGGRSISRWGGDRMPARSRRAGTACSASIGTAPSWTKPGTSSRGAA